MPKLMVPDAIARAAMSAAISAPEHLLREHYIGVLAEQRWPALDAAAACAETYWQVGNRCGTRQAGIVRDPLEQAHRSDLRVVERLLRRVNRAGRQSRGFELAHGLCGRSLGAPGAHAREAGTATAIDRARCR